MCLKKTHDEPKIAQDDIEVWKVLTLWGESPFKGYQYQPGMNKPSCAETTPVPREQREINGGYLHAFRKKEKAKQYADTLQDYYDSFNDYYLVYRMLIPRGSIYYEGEDGDICSERLYWPDEDAVHPNPVKWLKEV